MSERSLCKSFVNGACAKGDRCPFSHDFEAPPPKNHTVRPDSSSRNARFGLGSSRYPNMDEEDESDEDDDDGMAAFAFQSMLREASAFPDLYGPDICDLAGKIDNPDLRAIQLLVHHLYHPHPSAPVHSRHG